MVLPQIEHSPRDSSKPSNKKRATVVEDPMKEMVQLLLSQYRASLETPIENRHFLAASLWDCCMQHPQSICKYIKQHSELAQRNLAFYATDTLSDGTSSRHWGIKLIFLVMCCTKVTITHSGCLLFPDGIPFFGSNAFRWSMDQLLNDLLTGEEEWFTLHVSTKFLDNYYRLLIHVLKNGLNCLKGTTDLKTANRKTKATAKTSATTKPAKLGEYVVPHLRHWLQMLSTLHGEKKRLIENEAYWTEPLIHLASKVMVLLSLLYQQGAKRERKRDPQAFNLLLKIMLSLSSKANGSFCTQFLTQSRKYGLYLDFILLDREAVSELPTEMGQLLRNLFQGLDGTNTKAMRLKSHQAVASWCQLCTRLIQETKTETTVPVQITPARSTQPQWHCLLSLLDCLEVPGMGNCALLLMEDRAWIHLLVGWERRELLLRLLQVMGHTVLGKKQDENVPSQDGVLPLVRWESSSSSSSVVAGTSSALPSLVDQGHVALKILSLIVLDAVTVLEEKDNYLPLLNEVMEDPKHTALAGRFIAALHFLSRQDANIHQLVQLLWQLLSSWGAEWLAPLCLVSKGEKAEEMPWHQYSDKDSLSTWIAVNSKAGNMFTSTLTSDFNLTDGTVSAMLEEAEEGKGKEEEWEFNPQNMNMMIPGLVCGSSSFCDSLLRWIDRIREGNHAHFQGKGLDAPLAASTLLEELNQVLMEGDMVVLYLSPKPFMRTYNEDAEMQMFMLLFEEMWLARCRAWRVKGYRLRFAPLPDVQSILAVLLYFAADVRFYRFIVVSAVDPIQLRDLHRGICTPHGLNLSDVLMVWIGDKQLLNIHMQVQVGISLVVADIIDKVSVTEIVNWVQKYNTNDNNYSY
jgi:hypothetical protein